MLFQKAPVDPLPHKINAPGLAVDQQKDRAVARARGLCLRCKGRNQGVAQQRPLRQAIDRCVLPTGVQHQPRKSLRLWAEKRVGEAAIPILIAKIEAERFLVQIAAIAAVDAQAGPDVEALTTFAKTNHHGPLPLPSPLLWIR